MEQKPLQPKQDPLAPRRYEELPPLKPDEIKHVG